MKSLPNWTKISIFIIICFFKIISNKITILSPSELAVKFEGRSIPAKYSTYGNIQHGISTTAKIIYDPEITENQLACSPLTEAFTKDIHNSQDKTIVMIDRGECTFVQKTRYVQQSGADIALVINHQQNFDSIFALKDDGTGSDINITTILIPENEGNIIKDFILSNKGNKQLVNNIILSVNNTYEDTSDFLRLTVFFNPTDFKVYKILNDLRNLDENFFLSDKILFNPIYTFDSNIEDEEFKKNLIASERCICHNRYCEDYEVFEGRKGSEIILEAIRQKSIYLISAGQGEKIRYFDYLNNFYLNCLKNSDFNIECSENILRNLNNNPEIYDRKLSEKILEYTIKSFKPDLKLKTENMSPLHIYDLLAEKSEKNIYLEEHAFYLNKNMKKGLPLIMINDEVFYGSWKSEELFKSICSALNSKSQPESCKAIFKKSKEKKEERGWESFYYISVVVSIGILIMIGIYLICRKYYFNHNVSKDLEEKNGNKQYLQLQLNIPEMEGKNINETDFKLNCDGENKMEVEIKQEN